MCWRFRPFLIQQFGFFCIKTCFWFWYQHQSSNQNIKYRHIGSSIKTFQLVPCVFNCFLCIYTFLYTIFNVCVSAVYVCMCVFVCVAPGKAWDSSSCCCFVASRHWLSRWCHLLNTLSYVQEVTVTVTAVSWERIPWKI